MLGGTTIVDASGVILWVDRPFGAATDYFIGKSFWDFCGSARDRSAAQSMFAWTLAMGEPTGGVAKTGGPIESKEFQYTFSRLQTHQYTVVSRFSPVNGAVLSPAEENVCALLMQDIRAARICELLKICPGTLQTHRRNILRKVGVEGLAGLTRWWEERRRFST